MTQQQEKHLKTIIRVAGELLDAKYRAGQVRHGGNLFDLTALQLVDEAIMEAVDQWTYLITLRDKLHAKPTKNPGGKRAVRLPVPQRKS